MIRKTYLLSAVTLLSCLLLASGCAKKKRSNAGRLSITSVPAKASITVNGKKLGKTPSVLRGRPGKKLVKIELPGYKTQWKLVTVQARKTVDLNFKLQARRSKVLVCSKPESAQVFIGNKLMGTTPLVLQDLKLGNHSLVLKKTGYSSKNVPFTIKDYRPLKVQGTLYSNMGTIYISSDPVGAQISINGRYKGSSPQKMPVAEGSYNITVSEVGYVSQQRTVLVKRGEVTKTRWNLRRLPGKISVTSSPEKAKVFLDGELQGRTPLVLSKLKAGRYKVKVTMKGFDFHEEDVVVYSGKTATVSARLENNSGGVDLVVIPPGSSIYVDGKLAATSVSDEKDKNFSKITRLRNLPAGERVISVAHKRARPHRKNIKVLVKKGEITRLKPVYLWVANAILKPKNGAPRSGHLYSIIKDRVMFSPDPGVRVQYRMHEIEYIKKLKKIDE